MTILRNSNLLLIYYYFFSQHAHWKESLQKWLPFLWDTHYNCQLVTLVLKEPINSQNNNACNQHNNKVTYNELLVITKGSFKGVVQLKGYYIMGEWLFVFIRYILDWFFSNLLLLITISLINTLPKG